MPEDDGKTTILSLLGPDAARMRLRHHVEAALARVSSKGALSAYIRLLFPSVPTTIGST